MVNDEELPSLAPLVDRVSPAVVNIRVSQTVTAGGHFGDEAFRRFFGLPDIPGGGQREVASAGSGVIVDADNGYVFGNAEPESTTGFQHVACPSVVGRHQAQRLR